MEPIYIVADTQRPIHQDIKVTQNDSGVQFVIKIQQSGKDVPLPPDTIYTLTSLRLDRVAVLSPMLGVVTDNHVMFSLGTKELAVTGMVRASVQMISADGRLSTLSFNYSVVRDLSDAPPSEADKTLIEVVLQEGPIVIDAAKDATQEALDAAEEARNAATTPGPTGPEGPQGIQGERGPQGLQGVQGEQGLRGEQGIQGERGLQGVAGKDGPQGTKGDTGEQGLRGLKGDTGTQGVQGIQGPKGDAGAKGDKGVQGATGLQGPVAHDLNTATGVGAIKIWTGTQAEYDAITNPVREVVYLVGR